MRKEQVTKAVCGAFLLIIFLVIAQLFTYSLISRLATSASSFPVRQGWYAVFLSDGQVYFGNILQENGSFLVLRNIYYIQQTPNPTEQKTPNQGNVSLLKLGSEIHEPEDYMEINRGHILFIEKLKNDGKVVKAIESYK